MIGTLPRLERGWSLYESKRWGSLMKRRVGLVIHPPPLSQLYGQAVKMFSGNKFRTPNDFDNMDTRPEGAVRSPTTDHRCQ
jgi:hypothetical protein